MNSYSFIVVNNNNNNRHHYYDVSRVIDHLDYYRNINNTTVIINENRVIHIKNLGTNDLGKIEQILNEEAKSLKSC